jgi:signal transduction histidine kinase
MRTNYRVRDNATKIWLSRPVAPEIESSIYRIIQETLSNIRQHANCTQLSVTLAVEAERWLTMEIQDNGCGFVVGPVGSKVAHRANRGLGLISMQERASQIGGELIINSAPGQGTSVLAKLPLAVT